jgi:hypothetical protein
MTRNKRPMTSLERSLYKLNAVRELGEWAKDFIDPDAALEDDGSDGNMGRPMKLVEDQGMSIQSMEEDIVWEQGLAELENGGQFDPDTTVFHEEINGRSISAINGVNETASPVINFYQNQPCVTAMPSGSVLRNSIAVPRQSDSLIVIIRHGKTEHNKLKLFTGWVSLLSQGDRDNLTCPDTNFHQSFSRRMHHLHKKVSKRPRLLVAS